MNRDKSMQICALSAVIMLVFIAQSANAATSSSAGSGIPSPPNFNVTSGTLTVCRGEISNIPIVVTNLGYDAATAYSQGAPNSAGPQMQQVDLSLSAKGFESSPNSNNNNNRNPGSSLTIYVPTFVPANASALVFAQVDITYNYLHLYSDSEVRNITLITERCQLPLSVSASPSTLIADQTENLTLNLTNSGNTTLSDLLIHISIPGVNGGVLEDQPIQLASIMPHSSVILNESIDVNANASSSSFPVNITTTYYNGTRLEQVQNNRFFLSTGLIQLTPSSITVSPSPVSDGNIFSMSFILTDTGTSGATGMTATALPTKGFSEFSSNSVFIGSISADSQTSVTLSQEVSNGTKPGAYVIPVRVNYLNNLRQNMSTLVNVTVLVAPLIAGNVSASARGAGSGAYAARSGSGSGFIIELIMLVIIVVLAYLLYKERKRAAK